MKQQRKKHERAAIYRDREKIVYDKLFINVFETTDSYVKIDNGTVGERIFSR